MKHFCLILTFNLILTIQTKAQTSQTVEIEQMLNTIFKNIEIKNVDNKSLDLYVKILNDIQKGDYPNAINKYKNYEISRDSSGRYKEYFEYATTISSLLTLINPNIKNPVINEKINTITKLLNEENNTQNKINKSVVVDTKQSKTIKSSIDTVTQIKYKLTILIDKIKIYDYCDGRQDNNYAGEFTSEIRIIKNNTIIKLYQQNSLQEKKGDEYILYNESQIPFEIDQNSDSNKEIKIEAYLYEWDGDEPTKLYNSESIPVNQWKNKFNEKYQPYHLSLDKDSECKAGLYYQVKLDKIK